MHEQTSDKKPDNWKMGRAEGPSFCNFYFNLVLRFLEKIAEFPCTGGTILSEPIGEIPKEFATTRDWNEKNEMSLRHNHDFRWDKFGFI